MTTGGTVTPFGPWTVIGEYADTHQPFVCYYQGATVHDVANQVSLDVRIFAIIQGRHKVYADCRTRRTDNTSTIET